MEAHRDEWDAFARAPHPEDCVPVCWSNDAGGSAAREGLRKLLVLQAVRADRVQAQLEAIVGAIMGAALLQPRELDLAHLVSSEVTASAPVLLCSVPGYDASHLVESTAASTRHSLRSFAMGSADGFSRAEQAIAAAARSGDWVLLKNVHLAPEWLAQLEKTKLRTLQANPAFRLFMTMEISPKVPPAPVFVFNARGWRL